MAELKGHAFHAYMKCVTFLVLESDVSYFFAVYLFHK